MGTIRLGRIQNAVDVVLAAAIDLRRETPAKVETSREQWGAAVAAADAACDPDTRDSPRLQHLVSAVRHAVRAIRTSGNGRFHAAGLKNHPQIAKRSRTAFSEDIAKLEAAVRALREFASSD